MKKYQSNELQPLHYHVITLNYDYPNDDHQVEFTRLLGVVTQVPETVEAVLAEYFTGEPLAQLTEQEIAELSPEMFSKMIGADLRANIYDFSSHDEHGCCFSVGKIQQVSFEQFKTLQQFADIKMVNVIA